MNLPDILDKPALAEHVERFYLSVRSDDLLSPIFSRSIADGDWPGHLEVITDFWAGVLWNDRSYQGDLLSAHQRMDALAAYAIAQEHFQRWLQLWLSTLRSHHSGSNTDKLERMARKMSTGLYVEMWKSRPA